jgi:hypothetical protein
MATRAQRRPTARRRAPARGFDRAAYEQGVAEFLAELNEERYRGLAGLTDVPAQAGVYARHAELFSAKAIDAFRRAVEAGGEESERDRALLAFATDGYLNRAAGDLADRIRSTETRAVIHWRGEPIGYRAARDRISTIGERAERNGLFEQWLRAVEAINPLRIERFEAMQAAVHALGYADYVEMVRLTRGWNPDELAALTRGALNASETGYYAAMRRLLARAGIEQGDGSLADAWFGLRGAGWDAWFEGRRTLRILEATVGGLGMALSKQVGVTVDLDPRPNKALGARFIGVRVPGDLRLVLNPQGGWEEMGAALHATGHLEQAVHVPSRTQPGLGLLGDLSVSQGYALLMEGLLAEPGWLAESLGMGEAAQVAFIDFYALVMLYRLRLRGGQLIYELGLYRGGEHAIHRAVYAGTLGLLTGVGWPEELYLATLDDAFHAGTDLRATMLAGVLDQELRRRHPDGWWRNADAGALLRELFGIDSAWNVERVVAHLGYDSLDWRPVLRKIRTQLIGEMSGYGGPNITTRAGTRKI